MRLMDVILCHTVPRPLNGDVPGLTSPLIFSSLYVFRSRSMKEDFKHVRLVMAHIKCG